MNAIASHMAIHAGTSREYGDRRARHRPAKGWIISQNNGMVE
jgi:hypothetical protein